MSHHLQDSLESLMIQAQQGDTQAYASLLEQTIKLLRKLLSPKISNRDDLNDLVQECLISIHKARHTYQPHRPYKPWMFAIARYRLADHFRGYYRQKELEQIFTAHLDEKNQDYAVTFWDEKSEDLHNALKQLPEKQRNLVSLTKIKGYTAKEVGQQVGMSESAVKVAVHRCVKKITVILKGPHG